MRNEEIVVLVTCGSFREAERLAETLVRQRLAACVNVPPGPARTVYRWRGKVEKAREWQLIIKTSRKRYVALEAEIRRMHSYEVPEIIALPIVAGSKSYMKWLEESLR